MLNSKALLDQWDKDHSWHPFTQMKEHVGDDILHMERGEGCWLIDTDGNRYLDGNAAIWTNVHGYSDPDLHAILLEQAAKLPQSSYLGLSNPPAAELCRKLVEIAPQNLNRCYFTNNGATAIETALKMSFQYWQLFGKAQKKEALKMQGAFHGNTFGAMAVSSCGSFHSAFEDHLFKTHSFKGPLCKEFGGVIYESDDSDSLKELTHILEKHSKSIACLVLESSVQGPGGMILQTAGFLKKVEQLCKKYEVHLILDEVFVGFCRLGPLLVCSQEKIEPDFLCLGKGLSGGYLPLAATLTSETVYQAFYDDFHKGKTFYHGHSFAPAAITCAMALKSIEKLEILIENGTIKNKINCFNNAINQYFSDHPHIAQINQRGFACALYLKDKDPMKNRIAHKICIQARENGIIIRPLGNSITLVPPIAISEEEIDFLCKKTAKSISEYLK